jgi:hypothetical protein
MGTWGVGPFENDDAAEWLAALAEVEDDSLLHEALDEVAAAGPGEYVEAPWGAVALAAAEVVAGGLGRPADDLPAEATAWLERCPGVVRTDHGTLALQALDRVAADSELRRLWDESPDAVSWHARVGDLRGRLE